MTDAEIRKAKIGDRVMFKPLSADAGEYCEGTITHKLGKRVEVAWDDGTVGIVIPHDYTRIFLKAA
jgi:hypothetical protein